MVEVRFLLPLGFKAAGVAAGIKQSGDLDLALIFSDVPASAAAVFTRNAFAAAPVLYDRMIISKNPRGLRGVVINAGNANACTGEQGLSDAWEMADLTAEALGTEPESIFVMSTGIIGVSMPMEKLREGIPQAAKALSVDGLESAARAIMTTDTVPKFASEEVQVGNATATVAGIAKGAGMIHPNMATMLSVIMTDASVEPDALDRALRWAVGRSFNAITVDGDTSTNDTVLAMANGLAGNAPISYGSEDFRAFANALFSVAKSLAKQIVMDGEGATKLATISVVGAVGEEDARKAAKAIGNSPLVKTAIFGGDPNWGRILAAVGYSGALVVPERVSLRVAVGDDEKHGDFLALASEGQPLPFDKEKAAAIFASREMLIEVDLGLGLERALVWTCDLSHDYVDINGYYHT
jgi:glutamate N-acetyltransferase/amino-acid N-acetyltransferase